MVTTFRLAGTRFFLIDRGASGVLVFDENGYSFGLFMSEKSFRSYHANRVEPVAKIKRIDLVVGPLEEKNEKVPFGG